MKKNYHTHTPRCKHAFGSEEEYIKGAIKAGFKTLGFSDHSPWPEVSDRMISSIRMDVEELDDYVSTLRGLKDKYKEKIEILIGLECEYFPKYMSWLKEIKKSKKLDYIILGVHFAQLDNYEFSKYLGRNCDEEDMHLYLKNCLEGMETGIFDYLAHPDLYIRGYGKWDEKSEAVARAICEKAVEVNMPLGYNLNGYAVFKDSGVVGYPYDDFWRIAAEVGCQVLIEYDAHDPEFLEDEEIFLEAERFLKEVGCIVIDELVLS